MTDAYLIRHGATEWSASGQHTSTTDLPLLPEGEDVARGLASRLKDQSFDLVLSSPRRRAWHTAQLAGFDDVEIDDDLVEWAYGEYEGITTDEIRQRDPDWTIWTGPTPGGESPGDVSERLDRVVARVRSVDGTVLLFGHGHALRGLAARWLGLPVSEGRLFDLDTATVSVLSDYRGQPVIERWNA